MKNYLKKLSLVLIVAGPINTMSAAEAATAAVKPSTFTLRPIQESDRQPLVTFFENPTHLDYVGFPEEDGGMGKTMKALFSKKTFYHTEVAESADGTFAGFINYPLDVTDQIEKMRSTYPEEMQQQALEMITKQRTLLMLGVCEGFRRQGIAQKLLEKMKSDCKENGAEYIMVGVKTANKSARAFYEQAGFNRTMPGMPVQDLTEEQKEQQDAMFETFPQQILFLSL